MTQDEYLPLIQAAEYLGVSRPTIKRLISEGELTTTPSPLDRRVKLVKRADLDRLRSAPRPASQVVAPQLE
jgi:excisionase family DNA binding protein